MEVYTWTPDYAYNEQIEFATEIITFESGTEQRRAKRSRPLRVFSLSYNLLDQEEVEEIWNFYIARYGAFDAFLYRNWPNDYQVIDEAVGTGAAVQTTWYLDHFPVVDADIPSLLPPSSAPVIRVAGIIESSANYTITRDTRTLEFTSTAPTGAITATYDFYRRVRFQEDKLGRELFSAMLWKSSLKLKELHLV